MKTSPSSHSSKLNNNRKPSGSGLGLSICKQIIESHRGIIYVDQAYKKGAQFVIILPKTYAREENINRG